eukprot:2678677-Pyramimonas_sp.AAC.1
MSSGMPAAANKLFYLRTYAAPAFYKTKQYYHSCNVAPFTTFILRSITTSSCIPCTQRRLQYLPAIGGRGRLRPVALLGYTLRRADRILREALVVEREVVVGGGVDDVGELVEVDEAVMPAARVVQRALHLCHARAQRAHRAPVPRPVRLAHLKFTEFYRDIKSRGLQRFTAVYSGLPSFTEVYRGLQRFTEIYRAEVYRGLQRFTEVYRGLPSFTEVYSGLQRFTEVYRAEVYRSLQRFTKVYRAE